MIQDPLDVTLPQETCHLGIHGMITHHLGISEGHLRLVTTVTILRFPRLAELVNTTTSDEAHLYLNETVICRPLLHPIIGDVIHHLQIRHIVGTVVVLHRSLLGSMIDTIEGTLSGIPLHTHQLHHLGQD